MIIISIKSHVEGSTAFNYRYPCLFTVLLGCDRCDGFFTVKHLEQPKAHRDNSRSILNIDKIRHQTSHLDGHCLFACTGQPRGNQDNMKNE